MIRTLGTALFLSVAAFTVSPAAAEPSHGLAMHGDLKYPADFTHFEYVNPNAPKGGEVKLAATDTSVPAAEWFPGEFLMPGVNAPLEGRAKL